jgi:hypothetical protein
VTAVGQVDGYPRQRVEVTVGRHRCEQDPHGSAPFTIVRL